MMNDDFKKFLIKRAKKTLKVLIPIMFVIIILFFFVGIYPIIILHDDFPYFIDTTYPNNLSEVNDFINDKYNKTIYPEGTVIISSEIKELNNEKDVEARLDKLFLWEISPWYNPYWNNSGFSNFDKDGVYSVVIKDNITRYRVNPLFETRLFAQKNPNGTLYAEDPYWLGYNRVGACRELSNLFSYMTSQTGLETRTIQTFVLFDHQWLEINISGRWMYYDPWCACQKYGCNLTYRFKWFNDTRYFRENCHDLAYVNWYKGHFEPTFTYF